MRHFEISIFTSDNTISINEPRQRNSGILQGLFLKRQNVLHQNSSHFIAAADFQVGRSIIISGHVLSIYACDPFTRKFFQKLDLPQPVDQERPVDKFKTDVLSKFEQKPFYGLNSYAQNGCVPSQRQFLENDRKVLKFFATFEHEEYIIHYFLCDDCIEVIEVKVANSGKDPFPKLIKRQKIPRKYKIEIHQILKSDEFLTYNDFKENQEVEFLGKSFMILGCDLFTSNFFKANSNARFSVYQGPANNDLPKTNIIIPPHNGIGSEEDSLQNVLKLVPKVPKKDYFSIVDKVGFLRLIATLLTDENENKQRFFYQQVCAHFLF